MKIMTILGTRPEIIRLSCLIPILDKHASHVLVHTGQNYDERLSEIFFAELGVRRPDEMLGVRGSMLGAQVGQILEGSEKVMLKHRPDRILILGDTNSALSSIIARRLGIPVYHMEAGNRCFDSRVPEEVNRRVIDHSSSVLLPYTNRSRENLLREGFASDRVYVTGNPIGQVISHFRQSIEASAVCGRLGVLKGRYFLVTMHRAENVDVAVRLRSLLGALAAVHAEYGYPLICSLHPRTRARLHELGPEGRPGGVHFVEPFGFFDFLKLEESAFCCISDSGTVQEEACILGVPNVTIRDVTERPETVECGSNVLCGADQDSILHAIRLVTSQECGWNPPAEYLVAGVAETVARIVTGFRAPDGAETLWRSFSSS